MYACIYIHTYRYTYRSSPVYVGGRQRHRARSHPRQAAPQDPGQDQAGRRARATAMLLPTPASPMGLCPSPFLLELSHTNVYELGYEPTSEPLHISAPFRAKREQLARF